MNKFVMGFVMAFCVSAANAKEPINVYMKYNMGRPPAIAVQKFIEAINRHDDKHVYSAKSVPGGKGETVIRRAFQASMAGEKNIIYGITSDFTFGKKIPIKVEYDKDKDFTIAYGISHNDVHVMVDRNRPTKNLSDLIKEIKSGKAKYWGDFTNSASAKPLTINLLKQYNLEDKMKSVIYVKPTDYMRAIKQGEIDFMVMSPSSVKNGKSVHDTGFKLIAILFSTNKNAAFLDSLSPIIKKVCSDKKYIEEMNRLGRTPKCWNKTEIKSYMKKELKVISR